ncbi:MAG: chromosomal replication initiator protein DnaA [Kiritimatiellaeota bacterium]|nr:chromosomal replication initiator protein DnaA [Kiritimatiellota bacterium]
MEQQPAVIWAQASRLLAERMTKDVFDRWIAVIEPQSLDGQTLVLTVPLGYYQTWVEANYLSLIRQAIASTCGRELSVAFRVDASKRPPEAIPVITVPESVRTAKPSSEIPFDPKLIFETFVVGPSNNFAHAASLAVANTPGVAYNPLFIYGGSGLGKTHLIQAIGHYISQRNPKSRVIYISSESFLNEYLDALSKKSTMNFRKKYRSVDVLLIDDIQFLVGKEALQEEFFHTFNALHGNRKQLVMTCDRPVSEMVGLEQRLVTRFQWGQVSQIEKPDVETRLAILRKKQEQMNVRIADDVLLYLAERIRSDVRHLEGALTRVTAYASLMGHPVTIQSVEQILRDLLDQERQNALTIEVIQRTVAEFYDIRLADMTSKQRPQSIAFPRQVAMYLCRELTDHSLPAIGEAFSRNHATVMHACSLITSRLGTNDDLRQTISTLRHKLGR